MRELAWGTAVLGTVLCLLPLFRRASGLECYVCHEQDGNTAKCLKTIRTCEQEEDRCLSEIRWSTEPYWSQGAEKQYYVSKRCATKDTCDKEIFGSMHLCHYIWYEDWKCAECCQGDRCNYYVTLGSSPVTPQKFLLILTGAISTIITRHHLI